MYKAVLTAFLEVCRWVGRFVRQFVETDGLLYGLFPIFAIGIAISALFLGLRLIKSIFWGA